MNIASTERDHTSAQSMLQNGGQEDEEDDDVDVGLDDEDNENDDDSDQNDNHNQPPPTMKQQLQAQSSNLPVPSPPSQARPQQQQQQTKAPVKLPGLPALPMVTNPTGYGLQSHQFGGQGDGGPPPNYLHQMQLQHQQQQQQRGGQVQQTQQPHHGHNQMQHLFPGNNMNMNHNQFQHMNMQGIQNMQQMQHNIQQQHMHRGGNGGGDDTVVVAQVLGRVQQELNINSQRELDIAQTVGLKIAERFQQRLQHLQYQMNQSPSTMHQQVPGHDSNLMFNAPHLLPTPKKRKMDERSVGSRRSESKSVGNSSKWTKEQDEQLKDAVAKHDGRNWKAIAEEVEGRDHVQCLQRWKKVLRPGLVKGHWSPEEDQLLLQLIQDEKMHSWAMVASKISGRTAKQCRERWSLNLDPSINRSPWTPAEDRLLLELHEKMGGKWSEIKGQFDGRTENAVKTRFKSLVRAKAREWTKEQDQKLIELRMKYGKNWAAIKKELPDRSKNAIKVRCKTLEYDGSLPGVKSEDLDDENDVDD